MINVWLMGGFGNALFQLFVADLLINKGHDVSICSTLTRNNIYTKMLRWTVHDAFYRSAIYRESNNPNTTIALMFAILSRKFRCEFSYSTFYDEMGSILNNPARNVFGYFQDKLFLHEHQSELSIFTKKIISVLHKECKTYDVCVHLRFGDSGWAKSQASYYEKVMSLISDKHNVLIVTDSISEAKKMIKPIANTGVIISEGSSALEDFSSLISAKEIICAPSTFSWWAAHCGAAYKRVTMPSDLHDKLGFHNPECELVII